MLAGLNSDVAAYRPLLELTDSILLTSAEVEAHLGLSKETISLWRRHKKGPPFITLPSGRVRYRMADVLGWELAHERGPLTLDRVTLAIAACADVPLEHRAKLIQHLQQSIFAKPDTTGAGSATTLPPLTRRRRGRRDRLER